MNVDIHRFTAEVSGIARGLYFHATGAKLLVPLHVHSPGFLDESMKSRQDFTALCATLDQLFEGHALAGGNPEVFQYLWVDARVRNVKVLKMLFYEGFTVYCLAGDGVDGVE